ncbi:MAG TPA: glycosyltransferase family 2 protein [bacterium]|nr:glycosyltransferase family 2 protein [bacterium]HPN43252.1 glycosyltransferase family 2 protein [bacterium]
MASTSPVLLVIPVFNEERFIGELLDRVHRIVKPGNILVVNDGSTDNTAAILSQLPVNILTHSQNRGKGAALLSAIRYAQEHRYSWILTMDGDGQHQTGQIDAFLQAIANDQADIILGNRQKWGVKMPFHRILSNGITSIILSLCSGMQRIHDSQCGFRAMRVTCLDRALFREMGFQFESEMILRLGKQQCRFLEIPVETRYGSESSSIHLVNDTVKFIKLVIKSFFWN